MNVKATTRPFHQLTDDEQRAELQARKRAIPLEALDEFHAVWARASTDYAACSYRVIARLVGGGEFQTRPDGAIECMLEGGVFYRAASPQEVRDINDAVRSGGVQIEVKAGVGLMGPNPPLIVLYQATGNFRPFRYRFQLPVRVGGPYQPCEADIEGRRAAGV